MISRALLDDDEFFSKLAEEAEKDDVGQYNLHWTHSADMEWASVIVDFSLFVFQVSDVSEADPQALLHSMKVKIKATYVIIKGICGSLDVQLLVEHKLRDTILICLFTYSI